MRKITILALIVLGSLFFLLVKKGLTPDFEFTNVVIETTSTNATIRWSTTVDTKPSLEYYAEENFTRWGRQHLAHMHGYPYSSNNSITLYNMKPSTTYLFRLTAKDINGNPEIYESNFTTEPVPLWATGVLAPDDEFDNYVFNYLASQGVFTRGNIWLQDLTITPKEINHGENITIQFKITNKRSHESMIGFIIEHHPPAYLIIHEENMSLKYFQYAKSVSVLPNQTINYKHVLRVPNYYPGVNSIIINYQGSQTIAETFTVNQPVADYIDPPAPDEIDYGGLFNLFRNGLLVCLAGIVILAFYNKMK